MGTKIISKYLVNRLKVVFDNVIFPAQYIFVGCHQILDATLITNENVDLRLTSGNPSILFKIDIEKTYDHVNWIFLMCIMESKGFRGKWRRRMFACINSNKNSILVKGVPNGFFSLIGAMGSESFIHGLF